MLCVPVDKTNSDIEEIVLRQFFTIMHVSRILFKFLEALPHNCFENVCVKMFLYLIYCWRFEIPT